MLYSANVYRPDLSYVVSLLGRFANKPGDIHWEAVKKVICYGYQTADILLKFTKSGNLNIEAYVDASYLSEGTSSITGFIIYLGGNPIQWKSTFCNLQFKIDQLKIEFSSFISCFPLSFIMTRNYFSH